MTRVRASIDLVQRFWQRHHRISSTHPLTPGQYASSGVHSDLTRLTPISTSSGLALSLVRLEAESHAIRSRQSRAVQGDSQTRGTYARHLTRYQAWLEFDQAKCCAAEQGYTHIPPFPCRQPRLSYIWSTKRRERRYVCPKSGKK